MQVYRELKKNMLKDTSLALGVFDGVHTGHQKVIKEAVEKALDMNLKPVVVTFSEHPRQLITGIAPGVITLLSERIQLFDELGVEAVVVIDFTKELAVKTAEDYIKSVLIESLGAKSITVGYNHKLGCDKKGAGDFLKNYGIKNNIIINIIPPVKINDHIVSSSVVRGFIESGDVSSAGKFLGRPFSIKGEVIEGQHLGRSIGFPTANLLSVKNRILPLRGVYSCVVNLKGEKYSSVVNVGRRPTVGDFDNDLVEAHLLNFDQDIYGEIIEVQFFERIREEKKFDSLDELKKQIEIDCNAVAKWCLSSN